MDRDSLLPIREVARRLGLSERTVWTWVASGRLPQPLRLSARVVRWRACELERWIESRRGGGR